MSAQEIVLLPPPQTQFRLNWTHFPPFNRWQSGDTFQSTHIYVS